MLSGARLDGKPVSLGNGSPWQTLDNPPFRLAPVPTADGLHLVVANGGRTTITTTTSAAESTPPALATPTAAAGVQDGLVPAAGVDEMAVSARPIGSLVAAPGGPVATIVVNLDALLSEAIRLTTNGRAEVYFAEDDSALLARVRTALAARGITVTEVTRAADVRHDLARTATAWSLRLAVGTASPSLLVALMGLVVLVAGSRRGRTWDLASLRMAGLTVRDVRRIAVREIVPIAVVGPSSGWWPGCLAVSARCRPCRCSRSHPRRTSST